ncbi:kelch-like protein 17 [Lingula anatina]|uniref:Kelch-like protein 17 n=1 Tax=Lingula anatina TaxID=7574 RepID=A0A1S3I262_LINAN|nr:kelch-like protein 17 [Lingula anatina]|eukprot:XP_013391434.1 kelch-like protein 17 [Lingula anatina]
MMEVDPQLTPPSPLKSPTSKTTGESTLKYTANLHHQGAFQMMHHLQRTKQMCDVILDVGDLSLHVHKIVLASCSSYFHAMFTNDMVEKDSKNVRLHDVDPTAMELLIEFMYTSEITVTESNVQILLPAASLLQLQSVREACCKFLIKQLHPTNVLGIRNFADTHSCEELLTLSHTFTLHNFVEVCETEEFLLLPFTEILQFVKSEDLCIVSEEQVFRSVVKWVKHDLDARGPYISQLLSHVKLPLLSRDFLMNSVESEEFIRSNSECKDLLLEAMKYHLMPNHRDGLQTQRTRLRRSKDLKPVLVAVGGGSLFSIHSEVEFYDTMTDTWTIVASMLSRRARAGVVSVNRMLYAIGGYDGAMDLCTAECYNPLVNSWTMISCMGTRRSCLGVCEWNSLVYAVGGYDGASCLSNAERYDPLTEQWTSIAAMTYKRRYLKLVVLDNHIYAVGGYDGCSHLPSVEKYNPHTNRWVTIPNMLSRRSNCGAAVLDRMIYVCGGNDGSTVLSSVERYSPRRGVWETVAPMHSRRSTHDAIVMDGMLYAVGGNDGSSSLNTIERYDPKLNRWTVILPMNLRRSGVGAAVVEITSNLRKKLQGTVGTF